MSRGSFTATNPLFPLLHSLLVVWPELTASPTSIPASPLPFHCSRARTHTQPQYTSNLQCRVPCLPSARPSGNHARVSGTRNHDGVRPGCCLAMTPSETKIVKLVKLALGSAGGTGADLCRVSGMLFQFQEPADLQHQTGGQGDAGYIDDITPALRGKSLWMIPRHERLTLAWADAHVESLSTSDGSDLNHPRPSRDRCRYPRGAHAAARSRLA